MSGDELRLIIKQNGISLTRIANELSTSPQNLNSKLNRQSLKIEFVQRVMKILGEIGSNIPTGLELVDKNHILDIKDKHHNKNESHTAALEAENALLRQQNDFLQKQLNLALEIIKGKALI